MKQTVNFRRHFGEEYQYEIFKSNERPSTHAQKLVYSSSTEKPTIGCGFRLLGRCHAFKVLLFYSMLHKGFRLNRLAFLTKLKLWGLNLSRA